MTVSKPAADMELMRWSLKKTYGSVHVLENCVYAGSQDSTNAIFKVVER